jgi:hypothetical protein
MRKPWHESSGVIPWLIIVALLLLLAFLIKKGDVTSTALINNKDVIDVGLKVITSIFFITAGTLSYIRFFKGRTLQAKLIITPTCGTIQKPDDILHWIEVEIRNTGSVSVWNYTINITAKVHGKEDHHLCVTDFVPLPKDLQKHEHLIDVGESAFEHAFLSVPCEAFAVTFQILVYDQSKAAWTRCITVSNKVSDSKN